MMKDSAKAVSEAVKSTVDAGWEMELHCDHPILLLQQCAGRMPTIIVR